MPGEKARAKPRVSQTASFRTPAELRRWLAKHHASKDELVLVYYKVGSGTPSVTWPQSVDEALCFGWIDGVRRGLDAERYTIRFTRRRVKSKWSAINLKRVEVLRQEGRMQAAGLAVHEARPDKESTGYTYERRDAVLSPGHLARLKKNKAAWKFFEARAPSYTALRETNGCLRRRENPIITPCTPSKRSASGSAPSHPPTPRSSSNW